MRLSHSLLAIAMLALSATGCDQGSPAKTTQVDTVTGGQIVVTNGREGIWTADNRWRVAEEVRIGAIDSEGPDNFARIRSLAADDVARIWVLESQASELRAFGPSGEHVRTIGRKGEGPGEFADPVRVDVAPDGEIWVMDPGNARLSVFDTLGNLKRTVPMGGGFRIVPWRGGFDRSGRYYSPVVDFEPEFTIGLGVFDADLNSLDTIALPEDPGDRESWKIVAEGRTRVAAGVPFQGRLVWGLSQGGTLWALITDEYRILELDLDGDTLRSITKDSDLVPVSSKEKEEALERLSWFTDQGGRVDPSMIPERKPAVGWFFLDELDYVWVARTPLPEDQTSSFDVFDPVGRFLGQVEVPFRLQEVPEPVAHGGFLYGVTLDEYDVQYVIRARVIRH